MKLFRHGMPGQERAGILMDGKHLDVGGVFKEDYDGSFFSSGGIGRLSDWLSLHKGACPELSEGFRFAPVIASPSKIVCVGLNYTDHSKETGAALPQEPILFFKSTTAICGPNDDIIIPRQSKKTDWEVELAVVIGKKTTYAEEKEAIGCIAGYILHNDYSERAFQMERGGQWVKGKSCDTFAPIGPYLVTPDEIEDVHRLRLWLKLNGKTMQDGNTSNLVFNIPFLIQYISSFMTLLPGDIISTGTPAGVGLGQKPEPFYLKPGDVVELGIDGLGSACQRMVSYEKPN
jgi:2,4-diketo-3-deoxy-L-fuconate hydrolase